MEGNWLLESLFGISFCRCRRRLSEVRLSYVSFSNPLHKIIQVCRIASIILEVNIYRSYSSRPKHQRLIGKSTTIRWCNWSGRHPPNRLPIRRPINRRIPRFLFRKYSRPHGWLIWHRCCRRNRINKEIGPWRLIIGTQNMNACNWEAILKGCCSECLGYWVVRILVDGSGAHIHWGKVWGDCVTW